MKCKQPRPGLEPGSPCPFPMLISITPQVPPIKLLLYTLGDKLFTITSKFVFLCLYNWEIICGFIYILSTITIHLKQFIHEYNLSRLIYLHITYLQNYFLDLNSSYQMH